MPTKIYTGPQGGRYYLKGGNKVYIKPSKSSESKYKSKSRGSSNTGRYKDVPANMFCGPSGGAAKGTYPVNTPLRAALALSYARHAPNPEGIRKCVEKIAGNKGWINPKTGRLMITPSSSKKAKTSQKKPKTIKRK